MRTIISLATVSLCLVAASSFASPIPAPLTGWERTHAEIAFIAPGGGPTPTTIESDTDYGNSVWSWASATGYGYSGSVTTHPYDMSGYIQATGANDNEYHSISRLKDQVRNTSSQSLRLEFIFDLHGDFQKSGDTSDNADRWDMSLYSSDGTSTGWLYGGSVGFLNDFDTSYTFNTAYVPAGYYLPVQFTVNARVTDNYIDWSNTVGLVDVRAYDESDNQVALEGNIVSSMDFGEPVPEPATMLLFGSGLAGLAGLRLRKRKR